MADLVEEIKEKNLIQDVVGETYPLQRQHGRYLKAQEHDSLVVDVNKQFYNWNSKGESGDVINWVMVRNGWDFKTACEWLARRAKMPEPKWSKESEEKRKVSREREDSFQVAMGVMQKWLMNDQEALDYCHDRGWTDETIQESGVGFSGRLTAAEVEEMRAEFSLHEIDFASPQAVCINGYKGDVKAWAGKWKVQCQENWVDWGMVPGLMGRTRLVYAHVYGGRVRTFSGRNILGAEMNKEGREIKSYNLPVALAGERQMYFNFAYRSQADEVVIVEGQADAITLGQWGVCAVALAGTGWTDHENLLQELRKRHKVLYLGMDSDEAGLEAIKGRDSDWKLGDVLGPMVRLISWEGISNL